MDALCKFFDGPGNSFSGLVWWATGYSAELMIAHRFATLKMSDRIGVLKDGELLDIGTHDKLMKRSEVYRGLFRKQSGDIA